MRTSTPWHLPSRAMLPNVYPELKECSLNGELLVVRNTFICVQGHTTESSFRRRHTVHGCCLGMSRGCCLCAAHKQERFSDVRDSAFGRDRGDSSCSSEDFGASCDHSTCDTVSQLSGSKAEPTTFMIRNLPRSMDRRELERLLDWEGFAALYDFLHVPADLEAGGGFGYGFVNFVTPLEAQRFVRHFSNLRLADREPIAVHESEAMQGIEQLIERYRNSPLMHKSVPAVAMPAIYQDGVILQFPAPTERLRKPQKRSAKKKMV